MSTGCDEGDIYLFYLRFSLSHSHFDDEVFEKEVDQRHMRRLKIFVIHIDVISRSIRSAVEFYSTVAKYNPQPFISKTDEVYKST